MFKFRCLILPQFSCFSSFFHFFAQKNIGKADLNQHWECTAPKRLSKYATSVVRRTILSHSFSNQYKPLLLLKGKKNSKFDCPRKYSWMKRSSHYYVLLGDNNKTRRIKLKKYTIIHFEVHTLPASNYFNLINCMLWGLSFEKFTLRPFII